MIHQVKPSEHNKKMLQQILDLQLHLLSLAARENSETGVVENVEAELGTLYSDPVQSKEAATWITRRKPKTPSEYNDLFAFLIEFASHSDPIAKHNFVEDVRYDIGLIYAPQQARLRIAINKGNPNWQKAAAGFFLEFYEILGTEGGLPEFLFQPEPGQSKFRRWDFIDNFTDANPDLRLCAVCDSTLYRTTINNKPYTSIEHFFPKSRYPHLAVHPFNLIPICPGCNSGAAGTTDPFGKDKLGMLGLILPYQDGQKDRSLSEQTYIYVSLNGEKSKHPFHLQMYPNKHFPDATTLIANFERIYKVQERWNNEMDWLDQHVFRRITQFLTGDVQSGNKLKEIHFLIDRFSLLLAIISKENLRQDPFGYATLWLIRYHIGTLQDSIGRPDNSAIYVAIQDWAETQQEHWQEYRDHAEEVMDRVPKKQ